MSPAKADRVAGAANDVSGATPSRKDRRLRLGVDDEPAVVSREAPRKQLMSPPSTRSPRRAERREGARAVKGRVTPVLVWLRLMRVYACLTAALATLVGASLAHAWPSGPAVGIMMAVVFLVTGGGNALNDYYDRHIDRINAQRRPLPSGTVSERQVLVFALALFASGIALSLALTPWCIGLAIANSVVLVAYARGSKSWGFPKNLCVGYLVGSVFLFGVSSPSNLTVLSATLAICAALTTISREIVMDIEDLAGDRAHGARTLPATLGIRWSYSLAYAAMALAVVLALVPYGLGRTGELYVVLVLAGGLIAAAGAFAGPIRAHQGLIAASIVQLLAFAVGGPMATTML